MCNCEGTKEARPDTYHHVPIENIDYSIRAQLIGMQKMIAENRQMLLAVGEQIEILEREIKRLKSGGF